MKIFKYKFAPRTNKVNKFSRRSRRKRCVMEILEAISTRNDYDLPVEFGYQFLVALYKSPKVFKKCCPDLVDLPKIQSVVNRLSPRVKVILKHPRISKENGYSSFDIRFDLK